MPRKTSQISPPAESASRPPAAGRALPHAHREIFPRGATTVPELRKAAKSWSLANKDIPAEELAQVVTALLREPSALKKCLGGILPGYMPAQRKLLDPRLFEEWLDHTEGWAAVDGLCYGGFTAEDMLGNFAVWKALIKTLAQSGNSNKRRGAIVLLTKPVTLSPDNRLSQLGFSILDMVKAEKSILLTKAISWLLRNLIKHHREEVKVYLETNKDSLPKVAIRETINKLRSGRKSGK